MWTRFTLAMAATLLLLAACTERQSSPTAPIGPSLSQSQGPDRRFGKVPLPGAHRRGRDGSPTPSPRGNMTFHNGAVMTTNVTYALFSGPDWVVNGTFTGDKVTSIESFLTGFGGSPYAGILTEYSSITSQSSYLGRLVNNGTALSADANASDVVNFVCGQLADSITPRSDAIYIVFTEAPLTNQGYLGWHSDGTCQTVNIKVALVLNLDGRNYVTDGVYHTSNAAALVNVMAHEVFEAATDPDVSGGWYATDISGEIGDKCNFVFNGYTQLANSDHFKVQTEWSNIANDYGVGLRNYNGEPGCEFPALLDVYITGPQDIPLHESDLYTAHPSGGAGGYTYEWQQRFWWQGVPSSWDQWFSTGSTNSTYASINACRIDAFDLQVRVTDAYGSTRTNFIHVGITNPCS